MKVRSAVAATLMVVGLAVGGAATAQAGPASAPNVVGMNEGKAIATLEAAGIKVRVATRNGSGPRNQCVVVHQQDLSGKTKTNAIFENGKVVGRATVVTPPSTTLNSVC